MNYEDIFRERGGAYHRAMSLWPEARREEFRIPLAAAAPAPGETVVDVPAGGGYLRRYLPAGCTWHGHEPCASFGDEPGGADRGLLPLPWPAGFADAALSVAGVHHLADKRPLFREIHRVLRPGGRFVLADAHRESRVARFLDEFVGAHNSTGHAGDYLGDHTAGELAECGFTVRGAARERYGWWFADRLGMGAFCRLLFDIRGIGDAEVADAVEEYLGISRRAGELGMNWELLVVRCGRA